MKHYIWPLLFAIIINLIVIAGIFHLHFTYNTTALKKSKVIEVNLNQLVQQLNNTSHTHGGGDKAWLNKHYGKAIQIKRTFSSGKHLTGYVVSLKSDPEAQSVIYSVNNGEYYFMGTVIDNNGKNISQANAHHYIDNPLDKKIYDEAQSLTGITQGNSKAPQAIIIIDPNSNLFPGQWNDLAYDISQGVFSIKWVLVNYLKPMGPNVASNILQANNKIAALDYNAKHYNKETQTGGYNKNLVMPKSVKDRLISNWSFVQKYDLYKLPVTILKSNNHYYVIQGAVMDETLESIFADDKKP